MSTTLRLTAITDMVKNASSQLLVLSEAQAELGQITGHGENVVAKPHKHLDTMGHLDIRANSPVLLGKGEQNHSPQRQRNA